jgi:ribosomal protein S27E
METDERRLDGNAAAGMLQEIFPVETTMVMVRCTGCGTMVPAGAETVYMDAPGMVMRCVQCESVLLTLVRRDGRYWLSEPKLLHLL